MHNIQRVNVISVRYRGVSLSTHMHTHSSLAVVQGV